jgi:glycerophosphoryl diester phosphodiesterase
MMRQSRIGANIVKVLLVVASVLLVGVCVLSVKRFDYCVPQEVAWLRSTPIAHRGLHDSQNDENSLGAFSNAISHGYAIELDVRLTKDGEIVIMHDNELDALGLDATVSDTSLADLKRLSLPRSGDRVPTFAEALAHIGGRTPILIDVKDFGIPGELEEKMMSALQGYEGEYAVQAFNPLVCRWFRRYDKGIPTGLLLADPPSFRAGWFRNLKDNLFSMIAKPGFIGYNYSDLTPEIAERYRENGVILLGWGLSGETPSAIEASLVDNVIFDLAPPGD